MVWWCAHRPGPTLLRPLRIVRLGHRIGFLIARGQSRPDRGGSTRDRASWVASLQALVSVRLESAARRAARPPGRRGQLRPAHRPRGLPRHRRARRPPPRPRCCDHPLAGRDHRPTLPLRRGRPRTQRHLRLRRLSADRTSRRRAGRLGHHWLGGAGEERGLAQGRAGAGAMCRPGPSVLRSSKIGNCRVVLVR